MKPNIDMKVDISVLEILKIYWPVMTLPLIIMIAIGVGGYFLSSGLTNEIHSVIVLYVYLVSGLVMYGGSMALFLSDVKKSMSSPSLAKDQ